jgi:hypothetical protein
MKFSLIASIGVVTVIAAAPVAIVTPARAADPASAAAAAPSRGVPRPREKQTVELTQKQTKKQQTPAGPMTMVAEVPVTLTVLRSDDERAVVRWKRGVMKITDIETQATTANPALKPALMKAILAQSGPLLGAMDNLTFDLRMSPKWEYLGLDNYEEVRAAAMKSFDAMDELRRKNGNPPLDPRVRDAILSRATLEQVFPKEALLYLGWHPERDVPRGQTATFETALPNPLGGSGGGAPVPGRISVSIDQAPDARGRLVVRTTSSVDMEKFAASMKQAVAATPGGKPFSPEEERAMREVQLEVTGEYHVDPATGLPSLAIQKKNAKTGDHEQSEEFVWTAR